MYVCIFRRSFHNSFLSSSLTHSFILSRHLSTDCFLNTAVSVSVSASADDEDEDGDGEVLSEEELSRQHLLIRSGEERIELAINLSKR